MANSVRQSHTGLFQRVWKNVLPRAELHCWKTCFLSHYWLLSCHSRITQGLVRSKQMQAKT